MGEVEQLVKRIRNLTPRDFAEFRAWFLDFEARVWDRQIEADVKAGKLEQDCWVDRRGPNQRLQRTGSAQVHRTEHSPGAAEPLSVGLT